MTKEKTILEWLKTAPDEWRDKAIANLTSTRNVCDLRSALEAAFHWSNSKEGFIFWNEIHNSIEPDI